MAATHDLTDQGEASLTDLRLVKGFGGLVIAVLVLGGGYLSQVVSESREGRERVVSLCNAFVGGVLLGGGLVHVVPEANHQLATTSAHPSLGLLLTTLGIVLTLLWRTLHAPHSLAHPDASYTDPGSVFRQRLHVLHRLQRRGSARALADRSRSVSGELEDADEDDAGMEFGRAWTLLPLVVEVAMVLQAVLEGLAIGMQTSVDAALGMTLAVGVHVALLAFSLTLSLQLVFAPQRRVCGGVGVLALGPAVGILAGVFVRAWNHTLAACLSSFGGGVMLCVAVVEILPAELVVGHMAPKLALVSVGFLLMVALAVADSLWRTS